MQSNARCFRNACPEQAVNTEEGYPHRNDVLAYLEPYEKRYGMPVHRPHYVQHVSRDTLNSCLLVSDGRYQWRANSVASATGTWSHPFVPQYPGQANYRGVQRHSAHYRSPEEFSGQRVLVVGGIADIVMAPLVKAARDKGLLQSRRPFSALMESGVKWPDGSEEPIDAVIRCTDFRSALDHLEPLGVVEEDCQVQVINGQVSKEPRLWLFG